jgi:hypothetical protein
MVNRIYDMTEYYGTGNKQGQWGRPVEHGCQSWEPDPGRRGWLTRWLTDCREVSPDFPVSSIPATCNSRLPSRFFFYTILCFRLYSWIGDHPPQEHLAKFGYRWQRNVLFLIFETLLYLVTFYKLCSTYGDFHLFFLQIWQLWTIFSPKISFVGFGLASFL